MKDIAYLTTLAGYIHWQLTGEKVMGVGEASGMFPIDSAKGDYDEGMLEKFRTLTGLDLRTILPKVLPAGVSAKWLRSLSARATPSSRSSAETVRLTEEWLLYSRLPAAEKLPVSARAEKIRSCSRSIRRQRRAASAPRAYS